MNRANREFFKTGIAQDLLKTVPFKIKASIVTNSSLSTAKPTRTFFPKVMKSLQGTDQPSFAFNALSNSDKPRCIPNQSSKNSKKILLMKSLLASQSTQELLPHSNLSTNLKEEGKEEKKQFNHQLEITKSRIPIRGKKLKRAIAMSQINSKAMPPELKQIFDVTDKDVNLVNCSKDATSLVLKILNQLNPVMEADLVQQIKPKKLYFRTNKPLGNNEGNIDFTVNRRYNHSEEIRALMKEAKSQQAWLSLSTYNSNDEDIQIFNKAEKITTNEAKSSSNEPIDPLFYTIIRARKIFSQASHHLPPKRITSPSTRATSFKRTILTKQ